MLLQLNFLVEVFSFARILKINHIKKVGFVHDNSTGCGDRDECTGGFWDVTLCNGDQPTCEEAAVATGQFSCIQCYNTIGSWYCGCNEGWDFIGHYADNDTYHANGTLLEEGVKVGIDMKSICRKQSICRKLSVHRN